MDGGGVSERGGVTRKPETPGPEEGAGRVLAVSILPEVSLVGGHWDGGRHEKLRSWDLGRVMALMLTSLPYSDPSPSPGLVELHVLLQLLPHLERGGPRLAVQLCVSRRAVGMGSADPQLPQLVEPLWDSLFFPPSAPSNLRVS